MSEIIEFNNKIAFHPGFYIKEYIEEVGLTQEEFAIRLGTTPKNISCLIRGEQSLSVDLANKLSKMLKTSVKYWLNLQSEYDSLKVESNIKYELEKEKEVFKFIDYSYFKKYFDLPDLPRNIDEQIVKVREFLKVSSLTIFLTENPLINFRSKALDSTNIVKANIMVQIATNIALKDKNAPKFDRKKFLSAIDKALTLTNKHDEFYEIIKTEFYNCGVNLVVIPNMKGSKVNGATRKIGNRMLLMLNDRNNSSDSFWFTLMHEIGHIINSDYGISYCDGEQEEKANKYAEDKLINPKEYAYFISNKKFDKDSIIQFSKKINRDPGLVVGRLQNDHYISFNDYQLNLLKHKYSICIA